jgi:restriction endonuclease S subunit
MKTTLGEIVDVIRCQLPRQRTGGGTGWVLCREITSADFDSISGLVSSGSENVWLELDPKGKQQKYLIQDGDVLFSFRGTEGTLGQVGLYIGQNEEFVVSGQSLCILRPNNVDVIWFYRHMRREEVREALLAKAAGSRLLTINLNDLRNIKLTLPLGNEIERAHERHSKIIYIYDKIQMLKSELIDLMQ